MSPHRGVGTGLGQVQQGEIGTDALDHCRGQLDHRRALVLAVGDIQDGGTSNLHPEFESRRRFSPNQPAKARPDPKSSRVKPTSWGARSITSSRQHSNESGSNRPPTASENASVENAYALNSNADDPDLATVVEAWPDLPEAIKAGILAMVKASAK